MELFRRRRVHGGEAGTDGGHGGGISGDQDGDQDTGCSDTRGRDHSGEPRPLRLGKTDGSETGGEYE